MLWRWDGFVSGLLRFSGSGRIYVVENYEKPENQAREENGEIIKRMKKRGGERSSGIWTACIFNDDGWLLCQMKRKNRMQVKLRRVFHSEEHMYYVCSLTALFAILHLKLLAFTRPERKLSFLLLFVYALSKPLVIFFTCISSWVID